MHRHKRFSYLIGSLAVAVLAVAAFLVLMGGSQTRAAPPSRPLAHTEITSDTVWGPGVMTVTEDVVIKNGATLVVTPGTTVRIFTDTAPYLGGVSDTKIEIIVEDGRLVADGFITDTQIITPFQTITFTSAFSDGKHPWWGIRILDRDAGESVINYALVERGTWGIYVENSSPTVTHSIIRYMGGDDGADGIAVTSGTHDISADPLFVDVFCMDCEDFRLFAGSPCIDTASNDQAPADDHDRILRPQDGDLDGDYVADMGAYEHITGTTTFTITPGAGDVITTPDGLVEIEWPTGAITCSSVMTYTPLGAPGQALPGALVFGGIAFDLQATDCNGDPLTTDFLQPLNLTVHYAEPLLPFGMDEDTMAIHKWDGTAEQWVKLPVIGRNTSFNIITVRLERLCEFDLLGTVVQSNIYLPLVLRNYAP